MKIRKATRKDVSEIKEICEQGLYQEWTLQHRGDKKKIKKGVDEDMKFHKKTIIKNLVDKSQYWIVLEEEDGIISFGSAYIKDNKGVIESVYVTKAFQRKGYGKKTLRALISWLKSKKVKHIETNVLIGNELSIKLHENIGFKPYILRMRLK